MKKLFVLATTAFILAACGGDRGGQSQSSTLRQPVSSRADTIIYQVWMTDGYGRSLPIIDSLGAAGELSPLRLEYYRGIAYVNIGQRQKSIDCFRRVIADENPPAADFDFYISAGTCLAEGLLSREDCEGALSTALAIEDKVRNTGYGLSLDIQRLYTAIGLCQIKLQRPTEAAESFERAYHYVRQSIAADSTGQQLPAAIATLQSIAGGNLNANHAQEAEKWFNREDSLLAVYGTNPAANHRYMEVFRSGIMLGRAQTAQALGRSAEAASHYADFVASGYGQSDNGRLSSCDYLMAASRYAEAAENYTVLDRYMVQGHLQMDLDNISIFMNKLRANYYAGRRDSALRVAMQIAGAYDSALVRQKHSDAAELATIYDTQGKERQIALQQAELSQERWIGTMIAMALITAFFIIYIWFRRRAQQRLAAAHAQLQTAYDQLEETTAAKERIESELRIARNIQMSMVPGVFPDYPNLDMYASMTPAKEVGGDLYGYVIQGEQLYFCIGDVSGKGVPASLFMAQCTRLFQTLAKEGMMPTDIAFRMNNELAENNDSNMFVTMFIGLVNLRQGSLDFCNCGHNFPIIDGQFFEMDYQNMPLGLWENYTFQGECIEDIRSRQILIYTDGLNEAENRDHKCLGDNQLLQLMSGATQQSARQVIDMLNEAVDRFRDGAEPSDDLTLMCLRVH